MNLILVAANLRHSKANSHRPAKVVAGQVKSSRSPKGKKLQPWYEFSHTGG